MKMKYLVLALTAPLIISGCSETLPEAKNTPPNVRVFTVGNSANSGIDDGYYPAVASAADRARLAFRVSGEIIKLNVKDGDSVTKGQVIAELDPTDYKLDVDNSQASFNVADSQYRRSESLVKKGMLAQSQFDELAAQRMIAKAELDLAKLRLSFTKLKAPVDGLISRVNVDQYENVQAGQQIVNIHNSGEVDILVQASDQIFVKQTEKSDYKNFRATVKSLTGQEYSATLKEYTTELDPATQTYNVTLTMPMPENQAILDGMAVEVRPKNGMLGGVGGVIGIPVEALFNPDGETLDRHNKYVWVVNDDNTVTKTKVSTAKATFRYIRITDGLEQGQKIVIAGISKLRDGMTVEPLAEEAEK